ncbi:MAG: Hsp70 family protein [Actinomycetia bacterium]|nr:Hsp70 family protein [Actinomycetes bacterium]
MSYQVGVDLGTTYTAAAVYRNGRASICSLGSRGATIPSVVLLREDGTFLTGEAAERRAATEPERVVREFKRRFGDSTPLIVAGSPYSAEALTARLLQAVVVQVSEREGGTPDRIVVTYPANWGDYKKDLLDQAMRLAGLDDEVVDSITEPEAAVLSYAAQERVEPGEVVAVYDLGGGTFDAAILRRTTSGFSILGRPEGIERLGGIDFDAAVFAHITNILGDAITELDPEDPAALAAVSRLRRDCVDAKEALSSDTDASIPVLLPTAQTEVRITRHEFEALIRPSLVDSLEAMKRAVRSAELELDEVSRVLLVGGSSRIPVVSQLVASELRRPIAVDVHPKHTVAVGAAYAASGLLDGSRSAPSATPAPNPVPNPVPTPSPSPAAPAPAVPTPAPKTPPAAFPVSAGPSTPADPAGLDEINRTMVAPAETPAPVPEPPPKAVPVKAKPLTTAEMSRRPGPSAPGSKPSPGMGPPPSSSPPAARPVTPDPAPVVVPKPPGSGTPPSARPISPGSVPGPPKGVPPAPRPVPSQKPSGIPPIGANETRVRPSSKANPVVGSPGQAAPVRPLSGSPPPAQRPSAQRPAARPPGGPSTNADSAPTSIYRPDNLGRTSIYPGGQPPHGVHPPSHQQQPGSSNSNSTVRWILAVVILVAVVTAAVLVIG